MKSSILSDRDIEIPCPNCGHKTSKTVAWIEKNCQFACDGCGREINLKADQFRAAIKKVDKSVDDLKRSFRKISKG